MAHRYVSTAQFRSPYGASSIPFGSVDEYVDSSWPRGRSYFTTAHFRGDQNGYWQDNSLFGLGDISQDQRSLLPSEFRRYVETGEPMPELMRDVGTASAQVPRWAWGAGAAVSALLAWRSYKRWKKSRRTGG